MFSRLLIVAILAVAIFAEFEEPNNEEEANLDTLIAMAESGDGDTDKIRDLLTSLQKRLTNELNRITAAHKQAAKEQTGAETAHTKAKSTYEKEVGLLSALKVQVKSVKSNVDNYKAGLTEATNSYNKAKSSNSKERADLDGQAKLIRELIALVNKLHSIKPSEQEAAMSDIQGKLEELSQTHLSTSATLALAITEGRTFSESKSVLNLLEKMLKEINDRVDEMNAEEKSLKAEVDRLTALVNKYSKTHTSLTTSVNTKSVTVDGAKKTLDKAHGTLQEKKKVAVIKEKEYNSLRATILKELAVIRELLAKLLGLDPTKATGVSVAKFHSSDVQAQVLAQAACVALNPSGWAFAIKRDCGSSHADCNTVCKNSKESQAGKLMCFNSLHIYGNQASQEFGAAGLKTYRYNSCGGGCGPNYCCCKNGGSEEDEETADVDEEDNSEDFEDMQVDQEETDNESTALAAPLSLGSSFSRHGISGLVEAQAACTALIGHHWSFAVRRNCGKRSYSCADVCSNLSESQSGKLKCVNALHLYTNGAFTKTKQVGLKTYKYNSCGGGCGPNYCCCLGDGKHNDKALAASEDIEETTETVGEELDLTADLELGGIAYSRFSSIGQVQAEATCTALNKNGGWSFAVPRDCGGIHKEVTCTEVCEGARDSQAGANGLKVFNALHLYSNAPASRDEQVGLKTYVYQGPGGKSCGPNFCCCRQK